MSTGYLWRAVSRRIDPFADECNLPPPHLTAWKFVLLFSLAFLISIQAQAATNTWQGTTGLWATTTNWSAGHAPLATEDAVFPTPAPNGITAIAVPAGALANSLTLNDNYALSSGDLTNTTGKINVATGKSVSASTTLAGAAGLTLNTTTGSAGTLSLTGVSTYTGTTTISGGSMVVGGNVTVSTNGPLGNSATAIVLGNASTTTFNSSSALLTFLFDSNVTIARAVTVANFSTSGIYSIGCISSTFADSVFSGAITVNQPLKFTIADNVVGLFLSGNITSGVAGTHILTFDGPGNIVASGAIGGGTGALAVSITGGIATLGGPNTFTGGVTLNAGTLSVSNATALGAASGTLTINGGTLVDNNNFVPNPTVINSDFNATNVYFTGLTTLGTAAGSSRTVTVALNAMTTFKNAIANGSFATSLVKAGAGTLVLQGNNTFSGGVSVNAGILDIGAQGTGAANSALGTGPLVIAGGTTIADNNHGDIDLTLTTKNTVTINGDFSYTGDNSLRLGTGAVSLGSAAGTSRKITILPANFGTLTLAGPIVDGSIAKSLIVDAGNTSIILSGNSTFTGGVTVLSGTLNINAQGSGATNSALGTGPLTISDGALIDNTSAAAINLTGTTNNAVIVNGDFTFTGTQNLTLGTGSSTLGTTAGSIRTITVTASTLGLGSIGNGTTANTLTVAGPGFLSLAGSSTFSGAANVNSGKLILLGTMASTPAINVSAAGVFDIQASGANPAGAGRLSDSATITLSGGVFSMEAPATNDCTETVGTLAFTPGTASTILLAANGAFKCQLTAGSALPALGSASLNLIREQTSTGTANLFFGTQTTDIAAPISGYIVNGQTAKYDATGATGLVPSSGANAFISKQIGTWGTATTWVNGTVPLATDMVVIRHTVSLGAARTTQAVVFDQGNGSLTGAGAVTLTNTSGQYNVLVGPTGSASSTIAAPIAGTSVIKNGPGALILSGTNTYTGATVVNAGALQAKSAQAFGVNSPVTLANVAGAELAIVTASSVTISIGSLTGGGAAGGNVDMGDQLSSLQIGGDNTSPGPYAGSITGLDPGFIIKVGTGTLTLSGTNGYSVTQINAGVLSINQLSALGSNSLNLQGGTLQYTGPSAAVGNTISFISFSNQNTIDVTTAATTLTLDGFSAISGTGGLTKVGAGTLLLPNSQNSYTGVTKISAGVLSAPSLGLSGQPSSIGAATSAATNLIMDGGTLQGSGGTDHNFTITAGKTAFFDTPDNMEFDGVPATSGSVVKNGTGTLVFGGAMGYTGTTTINSGSLLIVGNTAAIASSSAVNLGPGTVLQIESPAPCFSSSATVTLNGSLIEIRDSSASNHVETVGSLVFGSGGTNTIVLSANSNFKCQLISGGPLPSLTAPVNLFRNTSTADLIFSGQSVDITQPPGYTVNGQLAKYDATSATPQGLIQLSGNIVATQAAGNWGTAGTWVGNAVPAIADTVVIRHAVTLEAPHTAQVVMFDTGNVTLSGSAVTSASGVYCAIESGSTINAPIAGTSFRLSGLNGAITFNAANTYTGTTTIDPFVSVGVGNGAASGTLGPGSIVNNGSLGFYRSDTVVVPNDISGTGALAAENNLGKVILTGNNTYSGITIVNGPLQIGNGGTSGTLGTGEVECGSVAGTLITVTINRSDSLVIAAPLGEPDIGASLTQAGTGTTTLTGYISPLSKLIVNAGNVILATGTTLTGLTSNNSGTTTVQSGASLNSAVLNNVSNLTVAAGGTLGTATASSSASVAVNGTAGSITLKNATNSAPASAGCLLRGTGSAGDVTLSDNFPYNACIWPGNAQKVSTLASNEQLTVNSVNASVGGKLAVVIKNSGNFSQKLIVNQGVTGASFVFSFASDTTPAAPANYTVMSCTNGSQDTSFSSVLAPPGFVMGTHYNIRYSISGASPLLHSAIGQGVPLPGGYNQVDLLFTGNSVTPVTVDSFSAHTEGAGVRLAWHCASEFQNAGFNVYRCTADENDWTRINPVLIAGRLSNPDAKMYQFYHWTEPGAYRYKLESVSVAGERESYADFAGPVTVDTQSLTAGTVTADSLEALQFSLDAAESVNRSRNLSAMFSQLAANPAADWPRFVPAVVTVMDGHSATRTTIASVETHSAANLHANETFAGVRWFSNGNVSSSYTAAKVVYSVPGVLAIPQSSLPPGFDIHHVAIQREGRTLSALAVTPDALLVYGAGYQNEYTDKDALFLRSIAGPTAAGQATAAHGLFESAHSVSVTAQTSVTATYHDVYFDFNNLRPYDYAPWFSAQYLTGGSTQRFAFSTPNASGGAASLTVNLWSLTHAATVSPDHALQVLVNGHPAGQAQWTGGSMMLQLTFQVDANVLNDGANQIELVTPALERIDTQIALLHSITLNYTRGLDGSKPIEIVCPEIASQLCELSDLPSANAWVVDARFPDRAMLIPYETQPQADGAYKLRFIAKPGGSGTYLVVPAGQENRPITVSKRQVKALKSVSYLAVGPNPFSAGVQPLLLQRSKDGLRGAFVDQEQVFDYYNYGRFGPAGIQNAVRALRPRYLLLLGRTTYDYRNYSGLNVDPLCPTFLVSTAFWSQATSDSMFGDLGRGYPEVAVGRLPVNNAGELAVAVKHILAYKGAPASGIRVNVTADRADPAVADFAAHAEMIAQSNPDFTWQQNYLGVTYQSASEVTAAMREAANGGADVLIYVGHGNSVRLGKDDPRILQTDDTADNVKEWVGNVVFLQSTCTANWMAKNQAGFRSIAIQALTQPQGGISASIGSSTYTNPDCSTAFMIQLLKHAETAGMRWGDALMKAQQWAALQGGSYGDLNRTEQIFGDPAIPVFSKIGKPIPHNGAASGRF